MIKSLKGTHEDSSLRWFLSNYVRSKWILVLLALVFMAIEGSTLGFLSYSVKELFDTVFLPKDKSSVMTVALFIFAIFSARALSGFLQRSFILKASIEIVSALQKNTSAHLIDLDYEFFFKNSPGDLIERIKGDGQIIQVNFAQIVMALGRDSISLLALLSVAFWIDWKWAVISLLGLPVLIIPILLLQRYIHRISKISRGSSARATTLLDEAFHGIASIKLNGIEHYIKDRLNKVIDRTKNTWFGAELGIAGMPALIDLVAALGFLGVMLFGGMEIIEGRKSIGEFMSFFTAMALIFEPLRRLSNVSGQIQLLKASLERLYSLNKAKPKINRSENFNKPMNPNGKPYLEFKKVSLTFSKEVLSDISLSVEEGQFVAFVGHSGSGKTTMLNLISRLIEPTKGQIYLKGLPLNYLPTKELRESISVVTQESTLFDDTVFHNITLDENADENQKFWSLLEKLTVGDFVKNLNGGLNFQVGPRGLNLSGGQRQRIALARALMRDPDLLLLDEPTSALDTDTENKINKVLHRYSEGRTTIITTHKLELAKDADIIFFFQGGKIVAKGDHKYLMEKSSAYQDLWSSKD